MAKMTHEQAVKLAERLSTNFHCWIFDDITRADAVDTVARYILSLEREPVRLDVCNRCICGQEFDRRNSYRLRFCHYCGSPLDWTGERKEGEK